MKHKLIEALLRRWEELEPKACSARKPPLYSFFVGHPEAEVWAAGDWDCLSLIQGAVQQAIKARGWHYQLLQSELLNNTDMWAMVYTDFQAEPFEADSDSPDDEAFVLLSAYIMALEAQP